MIKIFCLPQIFTDGILKDGVLYDYKTESKLVCLGEVVLDDPTINWADQYQLENIFFLLCCPENNDKHEETKIPLHIIPNTDININEIGIGSNVFITDGNIFYLALPVGWEKLHNPYETVKTLLDKCLFLKRITNKDMFTEEYVNTIISNEFKS